MNQKYELLQSDTVQHFGHTLYRVRALRDIGDIVKAGDLGGYIEAESNLDVAGDCWINDSARVYGDAQINDNAQINGNAWVGGDAFIQSNDDFVAIDGIGSHHGATTAYKCKDGSIEIVTEGFRGSLEEFEKYVQKTHGDNKFAQEYRKAIELIKLHIQGDCPRMGE